MKIKRLAAGFVTAAMALTAVVTPICDSLPVVGNKLSISAGAVTSGDYEYRVWLEQYGGYSEVAITGYNGTATKISIPEYLDDMPVTKICENAFFNCNKLTGVTIPDSVKNIQAGAFLNCNSLKEITIPANIEEIGDYAFGYILKDNVYTQVPDFRMIYENGTEGQLYAINNDFAGGEESFRYAYSDDEVDNAYIERYIGDATSFDEVMMLASDDVTITGIQYDAFRGCKKLKNVTIPDSITYIGSGAFADCTFKEVTIPASVTEIGDYAFGYYRVENEIGNFVYTKYDDFKINYVKNSAAHLYAVENGFTDEEVMATETLEDGQLRIKRYIGKSSEIVIPSEIDGKAVVAIGDNAFENCTSIKSVVIPDSVKQIGYSAFLGCSSLKSVTIPESVTDIGEYALGYSYDDDSCKYIKSDDLEINYVKNSEGHYYAAKNKFTDEECLATYVLDDGTLAIKGFISSAESFVIPSKIDGKVITQIDSHAFAYCDNLEEATVPVSVTYIDSEALGYNYTGGEYNASWNYSKNENFKINYIKNSEGHYYAAKNGFTDEECLAARATGDGTVNIRGYVGNAATLSIPAKIDGKSVTGIDDMAFYECISLNSITIPDGVTTIGYSAFSGCEFLEKIILPKNLEFIGSGAFSECSSLESVTLPDTIDKQIYIDDYAFKNCKSLVDITIPKSVSNIGEETFGYYDTETWETKKIDGFKIKCYKDTAGEQYAKENDFDYELLDHTNHTYGNWQTTKPATCTTAGTQTRTCSVCGKVETQTIAKTAHKYVNTVVKSTYTAKGYTLHKCSVCGASYKDNYTAKLTLSKVTGFKVKSISSTNVTLKWNKNANASGYQLQQYKNGKWVTIYTGTKAANTSYTVKKLKAGTAGYRFRIRAYRTEGKNKAYSGYSSIVKVNTNPYGVGGFKCSSKTSTSVTLKWNNGTTASGYQLQQYKNGKWVTIYTGTKATNTSYTVKKLKAGTAGYRFRIRAYKTYGNTKQYGSWSSEVKVNTNPYGVGGFKCSSKTSTSVTLKWNKGTTASGYQLQQYKNGKWVTIYTGTKATNTSYTVKKLKAGTAGYRFRIRAYKTYGNTKQYGSWSSEVKVNTNPYGVSGFKAKSTAKNSITLGWNKGTTASGYQLQQYKNGKWVTIYTGTKATSTSCTVKRLKANTSYKFRIRAYKTYGNTKQYGSWSGTLTVKTKR